MDSEQFRHKRSCTSTEEGLNILIYKVEELYYPCSKSNVADQLRKYFAPLFLHMYNVGSLMTRPIINEPPHGKTNNLYMRKQRRRSASKLISAIVSLYG